MKRTILILLALVLSAHLLAAQGTAEVPAAAETQPSPEDGAKAAALWVHPDDPARSLLITTDEEAGIVTYDLDGGELQALPVEEGEANQIDLRYGFPLNGEPATLIALGISDEPLVLLYTIDPETLEISQIGAVETEIPNAGLCMFFSPISDLYYVINTGEEGGVEQYELADDGSGTITATLRRSFNVGSETESCAADDELGSLYIVDGEVALWRYSGEPETGTQRRIVDYVGGSGNIETEMEGVTLYEASEGQGYVILTDEGTSRFLVYDRADQSFVGAFTVGAGDGVDEVTEPGGVDALSFGLGDLYPDGVFVTTDDVNTDPEDDTNFKLVSWGEIARALDLVSDPTFNPRSLEVATGATALGAVAVTASVETEPVPSAVDAADDPAIWIDPTDASRSTIIGTDKTENGGLVVYNLDGSIVQRLEIGEVNNVDLRYNFPLDGQPTTIVTATNRSNNSLIVYRVNEETRELENVAARDILSGVTEVYGFCMYVSATAGDYYAFINSASTGEVEQWRLFDDGSGRVDAELAREFVVGSQTEGCVADDELGYLYIGEEGVALWKYGAEPDAGDERAAVDRADEDGRLVADIEGIALYYAGEGTGYLIASSQGSSEYVVYAREGDNEYLGKFVVNESPTVDGTSGTDGIDVTNFPLGDAFPQGVFVAQDDSNINPDANQNFKLVSWGEIAQALNLTVDTNFNPRDIGAE
jgi:3-phytase